MVSAQRPVVNQRLYFVDLHLQWLRTALSEQLVAKAIVEQALGESIVLHLAMAYRSYLQEVAEAYLLPLDKLRNAAQLARLLESNGKESAECKEMQALENSSGWLSTLLAAVEELESSRPAAAPATAIKVDGGIRLHEVKESAFSLDTLLGSYKSLKKLIENQRTRLEEW